MGKPRLKGAPGGPAGGIIKALCLLCLALLPSCAFDVSHRPYVAGTLPEACSGTCTDAPSPGPGDACVPCSGRAPVEERSFQSAEGQNHEKYRGKYLVGYVEFDDQGWFQEKTQRHAIFNAIAEDRKQNKDRQYLIVVFAHGWKHNAKGDDSNVQEFNRLLERLDLQEQLVARNLNRDPRKVVGIYLAWRGASLTIPYLENLTFWTRKNAGERVGNRSAKQLLMEINNLRAYLNGWEQGDLLASSRETQLILIGHSFGGLLMYHALHTELMDRELHLERGKKDEYHLETAKSFGDFILLVNPAFEGSAYEPLFVAARSRCFQQKQRPIMAIVTSKSDWATKYAFPAGRLYTLLQSAPHDQERGTVMKTVGHLDRYITHDIKYSPPPEEESLKQTKGLSPTSTKQAKQNVLELAKSPQGAGVPLQTWYDGVELTPTPVYTKHFPYLVMSADKNLIKDHNDIWNDRFIQFVTSFITKEIMSKDGNRPPRKPPQVDHFWEQDGTNCR